MRCGFSSLPGSVLPDDNNSLILQNTQPTPTFSKLIIVEPMVSAQGPEPLRSLRGKLVERAKKRQALWRSREDLKRVFSDPNHSTVKWDPRVLDSFAVRFFSLPLRRTVSDPHFQEHALYWNPELKGFSLRCTPQQEVVRTLSISIFNLLDVLSIRPCTSMKKGSRNQSRILTKCVTSPQFISSLASCPILCSYNSFFLLRPTDGHLFSCRPRNVQRALIDPTSGRRFASLSTLTNVGHLVRLTNVVYRREY